MDYGCHDVHLNPGQTAFRVSPPWSTSTSTSLSSHSISKHPSTAIMPEPDKHAAAQQAVDILHEISTILVRWPRYSAVCAMTWPLTYAVTELPSWSPHLVHLHLYDRARSKPRGFGGTLSNCLTLLNSRANQYLAMFSKLSRNSDKRPSGWNNLLQQQEGAELRMCVYGLIFSVAILFW